MTRPTGHARGIVAAALAASLALACSPLAACQAHDPNDPTDWQNVLDQIEQESQASHQDAQVEAGDASVDAAPSPDEGAAGSADGARAGEGPSPDETAPDAASQEGDDAAFPAEQFVDAAYVAELLESGRVATGQAVIVDIRGLGYYMYRRIDGSINLPAGKQFELRLREIGADQQVVLVGESNARYAECLRTLTTNGYDAANVKALDGGIDAWAEAGYTLVADADYKC